MAAVKGLARHDSELTRLMRRFPSETNRFLRHRRFLAGAAAAGGGGGAAASRGGGAGVGRRAHLAAHETENPYLQQPQNVRFGDMPSFTGSILMPGRNRFLQSTMRASYKMPNAATAQQQQQQQEEGSGPEEMRAPIKKATTYQTTLKPEGEHDFLTTHRQSYLEKFGNQEEAKVSVRGGDDLSNSRDIKGIPNGAGGGASRRFFGETQFMRDFPEREAPQPRPPRPVSPLPSTINIRYDRTNRMTTEQRREFRGHDTVQHPAPASFRMPEQIQASSRSSDSTAKRSGEGAAPPASVMQSDFPSYRSDVYMAAIGERSSGGGASGQGGEGSAPLGKFYDLTTNRDYHRDFSRTSGSYVGSGSSYEEDEILNALDLRDIEKLKDHLKRAECAANSYTK